MHCIDEETAGGRHVGKEVKKILDEATLLFGRVVVHVMRESERNVIECRKKKMEIESLKEEVGEQVSLLSRNNGTEKSEVLEKVESVSEEGIDCSRNTLLVELTISGRSEAERESTTTTSKRKSTGNIKKRTTARMKKKSNVEHTIVNKERKRK